MVVPLLLYLKMTTRRIKYKASKTGAKFHKSKAFIRGFKGPVGSGKSVACIQEALRLSNEQTPNSDGIRKTRGAIVRNTRPELINTTLKTFNQWVPEEISRIVQSPQLRAEIRYKLGDGTIVECEVLFLALDQEKDVRKLLSLELSWLFVNEAREVLYSVIKAARERVGRYPSQADGYPPELCEKTIDEETGKVIYSACKRKAVLMDTNPPDEEHWWYHLDVNGCLTGTPEEEVEIRKGETKDIFAFFNSPPPLFKQPNGEYKANPDADNIEFLPGGYRYYKDMIAGNSEDHINVMVLGNYGMMKKGKPVYPEYNDMLHCSPLMPIKGLPIALGWDFGLTPSVVIGQLTSNGQLRILDEIVGNNLSVRAFARDVVKPFLVKKYLGYEVQFSVGDPSGNFRGDGEGRSSIDILNDVYDPVGLGFVTEGAPTNDISKRLDSVKSFMLKMVDGKPGYILDQDCSWLRKGKMGGYCYRRMNVSGERYADKPDKNDYSHPADAEQYLALGYIYGFDSASFNDDYVPPELTGGY